MEQQKMIEILDRYLTGTATETEKQHIEDWLDSNANEINEWQGMDENTRTVYLNSLHQKIFSTINESEVPVYTIGTDSKRRRNLFLRIAAAAVILIVISTTAFLLLKKDDKQMAGTEQNKPVVTDIAPGGDKAILTLADGSQIVLDTAANGDLALQGASKVIKIGKQIAYSTGADQGAVVYNTITTPKGGQYKLLLADGSKVWLNAASSLRFPTAFAGKERTVELTGEGYFEVTHNAQMPFRVKVNEMDVQVLGTSFNINSYNNEPSIKTTLLNGRVKVTKGTNYVHLNPQQQAIISPSETAIRISNDADVDAVVAWMNGKFSFNRTDVETIMRQIERWYNVDVTYEGKLSKETFSGIVNRNGNVSQVLKIMEAGGMKFKIEGRKIIVMQ